MERQPMGVFGKTKLGSKRFGDFLHDDRGCPILASRDSKGIKVVSGDGGPDRGREHGKGD